MLESQHDGLPKLSGRFAQAFQFALKAHGDQVRKGTKILYVSHVMAVSSIVLDYGGSEEQAIAALLHDTVEDCEVTFGQIRHEFGEVVERIVKDCTDAETFPKPPWKERKQRYIEHLRTNDYAPSLLVSAADKLHNAHAIVHDVKYHGHEVWKRFKASPGETLWYYESLCEIFRRRATELSADFQVLVNELDATIQEMKRLVAG